MFTNGRFESSFSLGRVSILKKLLSSKMTPIVIRTI